MSASSSFLEVSDIEVHYGQAILALRGVSLNVREGSIVALLGANGAGKTTALKAISNLLASDRDALSRGSITWRGEATGRLDPADLVAKGVVQVLEGRHIFPQLSIEENLLTCADLRRPSRRQIADDLEKTYAWFPRRAAAQGARRPRFWGRTTDGGDRPRSDDEAGPSSARRAVDGPRSDHRRGDLRDHPSSTSKAASAFCSRSRTPISFSVMPIMASSSKTAASPRLGRRGISSRAAT